MKKAILAVLVTGFLSLAVLSGSVYADCKAGHCPLKKKWDCGGGGCSADKGGCPITGKLMKKAHFFLDNQKEIGLKEDQVQAIKAIKMDAKKTMIRQMAEMKIFEIDMNAKMSEPQVDVEGINAMIDSASAGMASSAKATIASYVKLKAILSADQMAKAKEIWIANESGYSSH